jgi:hypothetical protein
MGSPLNINQFAQTAIRGQLDQQIAKTGVIQGQVSATNGATAINAGDAVDLDSTVTVVGAPQFITALTSDSCFGYSAYDVKADAVLTPLFIQVAAFYTGPVMWLIAGGTINPGQFVEQSTVAGSDVVVYGTSTNKVRGVALDPGTTGNLMRVILAGAQKAA